MTRKEAIKILKSMSDVSTQGEAIDMAIEALNNSIQMSNIQELQAENGFLKEMVKFYREQQTVAVVRCKDCRHYGSDGGALMVCDVSDMVVDDTDYCSYGERQCNYFGERRGE